MLKLRSLRVENFRGIRFPLDIEFVKGGNSTSALVYGRNGTGKSSLIEAWEWMLNFSIAHLDREGISLADLPHKASLGADSRVTVTCQHPDVDEVQVTFNPDRLTQPYITGAHAELKSRCCYPNYLRYSDLQNFVFKSKTDKYKYLAKFFGLEEFVQNQAQLKTTFGRLSTKLQTVDAELLRESQTLHAAVGQDLNEASILTFLNTLAEKHSAQTINDLSEFEVQKADFQRIVEADPKTKELTQWRGLKVSLDRLYPVKSIGIVCSDIEELYGSLVGDAEALKQIYLDNLFNAAIATIPQLPDDSPCPICDNPFEGNLLDHVREKHKLIQELLSKKTEFDTRRRELAEQFQAILDAINRIDLDDLPVAAKDRQECQSIGILKKNLSVLIENLKVRFTEIKALELSNDACVTSIEELVQNEAAFRETVAVQIQALENDSVRKSLADDYTQLSATVQLYQAYSKNVEQQASLNVTVGKLETLIEELLGYIRTQIQTTFDAISQEVMDCFNALEGGSGTFANPKVVLLEDRDKAVEVEIEFVGETIRPAFKFMSESQINSFGLSIFLASVKHFNQEFKFFILDDVMNSFDAYKRPRIPGLLASRFGDFQILMLTHDQIFFDTVQQAFPSWNRYRFTGWDYMNGPRYSLARNYLEEVENLLNDDNPIQAGQTLGRYLEWVLGRLSESTETALKYKVLNVYTLSEFHEPFMKRLRDKLKQAGYAHRLLDALDELDQGTVFRNYCAHWKNEATPFTTDEIRAIFEKWKEIERMLWCDACKSFVVYEKVGGVEYVRCPCNTLNLKDERLYDPVV